jgi:hypothetical protein
MNRVQHAAIALACVVASTSAMSAAQSSASINNLSFQVIDLDLSNGYNFQFNSQGRTLLSLSTTNNESGESDYFSRNRNGWLVPGSFESDLGFVTGKATVSAQGFSLSGQSLGNGSYGANASSGSENYWSWGYGDLSLSANTMVIITAKASVFASATNPSACSWWYYCSPSESASASAGMSLSYNYYSGNSSVSYSFNESLNASASATGAHTRQEFLGYEIVTDPWGYSYYQPIYQYIDVPMTEGTESKERTLTAVFVNHSDTTQMARFGLRASINGNATSPLAISPVPEPETWALLLAGLAVVGARVQRTRRAR